MMPEKGKKADLMFVQHMLSVLKHDGRLATVMPHGVLFRGGEEQQARKHFIEQGYLEAIIGLPSNLFYGTGIPACILVMNKDGATERDHVLFINADQEYREGKAQNHLRPEDIDKIIHAYRSGNDIPAYARKVPKAEIAAEDYNCNIRRYVDNAPPPEPHDVRAHLHGGVPLVEVDSLDHYWANYPGLREDCFVPRDEIYLDLSPNIAERRSIAEFVSTHSGVVERHIALVQQLEAWWDKNSPLIEALAPDPANQHAKPGNVYLMRSSLLESIEQELSGQNLLNAYQVRGAFANYVALLKADFKSIAASGWGPELIPDNDILLSQYPEVLEELEQAQTRLAELQALFAAASEEDFEDTEETGVLSADEVKNKKEELKKANAAWKEQLSNIKDLAKNLYIEINSESLIPKPKTKSYYTEGLTAKSTQFENANRVIQLASESGFSSSKIDELSENIAIGIKARNAGENCKALLKKVKESVVDIYADIQASGLMPKSKNKAFYTSDGLVQNAPVFDNGKRILELAEEVGFSSEYVERIKEAITQGKLNFEQAQAITESLERHKTLEDEAKAVKATIKGNESKRDELVEAAREKISSDEARVVILERLKQTLLNIYQAYLRADQRACIKAIENLWNKYAVTAKAIEAELDAASEQLQAFMLELGYE
jgi:type I restriction enzyme M protein